MVDRVTISALPEAETVEGEAWIEIEQGGVSKKARLSAFSEHVLPGGPPDLEPIQEQVDEQGGQIGEVQEALGSAVSAASSAAAAEAARQAAVAARGMAEEIVQGAIQVGIDAIDARNAAQAARDLAAAAQEDAETAALASAGSATSAAGSATVATSKADEAAGSASAASASATVATTKAGEAASSASAAATSASSALTYRDQAGVHAAAAQTAETNAEAAADDAQDSATASASSATAAGASQTAAGNSATAAANSATAANTSASNASTSASQASTSASNAAGSAAAASSSASVAASSSDTARNATSLNFPADMSQGELFFARALLENPAGALTPAGSYVSYSGYRWLRVPDHASGDYWHVRTRALIPAIPGRRWRMVVEYQQITAPGGGTTYVAPTFYGVESDWATLHYSGFMGAISGSPADTNAGTTGLRTLTIEGEVAASPVAPWIAPSLYVYNATHTTGIVDIRRYQITDITESYNSGQSASAAATSASAANTSASNAASSASAASTSATNANTSASNASTSASQASTSASNAASSASAASSSATVSASARDASIQAANTALPSTFEQNDRFFGYYFNNIFTQNFLGSEFTYPTVSGLGKVLSLTKDEYRYVRGSAFLKIQAGRTYKSTTRVRVTAGSSQTLYVYLFLYDANGDYVTNVGGSTYAITSGGAWVDGTWTHSGDSMLAAGGVYVVACALMNYPNFVVGNTMQMQFLRLEDITESTAAAGSASAAATSASSASASASGAASSASSATSSANTATTQAGNASTSASAAATSAAAASASASSASTSATLAASINMGSINANPVFGQWANASGVPDIWTQYVLTGTTSIARIAGDNGGYALQLSKSNASTWEMYWQNDKVAPPGYYVLELDVDHVSGNWNGVGMRVYSYDISWSYLANYGIFPFADIPIGHTAAVGATPTSRRYRFRKLIQISNANARNMYIGVGVGTDSGSTADGVVIIRRAVVRVASDQEVAAKVAIPTLEAAVATNSSVIADLNTRMATAIWEAVTSAGDATAGLRLKASTGGGGSTSSVAIEAQEVTVTNAVGSVRKVALRVYNGNAAFGGNIQAGGKIIQGDGSAGWEVAVRPKFFQVKDGDAVSWSSLGYVPNYQFGACPVAIGSGEAPNFYLDGLSATGGTVRMKINVPGTPSNYSVTVDAAGSGGEPERKISKGGNPDATGGVYTVSIDWRTTIHPVFEGGGFYTWGGDVVVDIYAKVGGTWTLIYTYYDGIYGSGALGSSAPFDVTGTVSFNVTAPSGVTDFGADGNADVECVCDDINSVSWSSPGTGSSVRTASPNNETTQLTVTG